jgi:glutaminase
MPMGEAEREAIMGNIRARGLTALLEAAIADHRDCEVGAPADYIPALAGVPPDLFALAACTPDGEVHSVGDDRHAFSIQSISKVATLALVLEQSGAELVIERVGVNPTGRRFNSLEAVEENRGRDLNPLVNAGAIATVGLVRGDGKAVWEAIAAIHAGFAGRTLTVDAEILASEMETNGRNRAVAHLMRSYGAFERDAEEAVELYTRQCAQMVAVRDLALMAGTLAMRGRNPHTGAQVLSPAHVTGVLAVMTSAGLYEDSGEWLFRMGLPAKSGVGGGIIAVVPGRIGLAAFSPRLDRAGASVRGMRALTDIARALGANLFL